MSKSDEKVYLTDEGFLELEQELNDLKNVRRPLVIKALKEARALGDLSENADYDAARNEQAQVEGRILELEKIMENVEIISKTTGDEVVLGSTVKIKYIDVFLDEFEYIIKLCLDDFLIFVVLLKCNKIPNWKHLYSFKKIYFYFL